VPQPSMSGPSGHTVTASYASSNGTALAGSDYSAVTGTVTFKPGTTTQTISVPILADTTPELAETFTVALSGVQHAMPPGGPATVTISANDSTVTLSSHAASLERYGLSSFGVYHPDVIAANPSSFNNAWRAFWNLPPSHENA
jgi:hypothetical protein